MGRALHIHSELRHQRAIPFFCVWTPLPKGVPHGYKRWPTFGGPSFGKSLLVSDRLAGLLLSAQDNRAGGSRHQNQASRDHSRGFTGGGVLLTSGCSCRIRSSGTGSIG